MDEGELERYRKGYEKAAEYYNLFTDNEDLPFYLSFAKKTGSPILDIAAGTGRVSIHLAREGFDIVSLESSSEMLGEFKRQLDREDPVISDRIKIIETDMCTFELEQRFPLIIIPTSFGHALTTEEQLSLLNCIHRHLLDDGLFVVDLFPAGTQPEYATFEEHAVDLGDGRAVSRSGVMKSDPLKQLLTLELTFTITDTDSGKVIDDIHVESGIAIIYNREFELLLNRSNLEIVEEFGDYEKESYTESSGRRIVVARKIK
ncbi:MAG: class I SAM-dependent methyltransferase [Candidatus Thorarchaeota archaeon]|jgi:SAM-dependent methyltransferase